ncbi:[FeFe] hydrogenase H-cluster radical SAM maturase HydE [bacterium M21]|nr:[FeFe] hydrogenase H-cluster radical SAM maturase HydE [bacterium M21]
MHTRLDSVTTDELVSYLQLQDEEQKILYKAADELRKQNMGDEIYIRGILEISNCCRKNCDYCGIRVSNKDIDRYKMTLDEVVQLAIQAAKYGSTTVVLQGGEDMSFDCDTVCDIVRRIKEQPNMAVTLSLGERSKEEYAAFRAAGADRYLMRFETGDAEIFNSMHPDDDHANRIQGLKDLRDVGMQLGSGFMIGLPQKGLELLASDLLFATSLKLDMIGCGPFISHPDTPLGGNELLEDKEIYFKAISLLRLLNPYAHIPATTAFDAIFKLGRDRVLMRGANVFMPNLTPQKYRVNYQLYPNKPCVDEDASDCAGCTLSRVLRLGRKLGTGIGHSRQPAWLEEHPGDEKL